MSEYPVRFTFKLPQVGAYVGPPSMCTGLAEISKSGVTLKLGYRVEEPQESWLGLAGIRSAKLKTGLLGKRLVIQATSPSVTNGISNNEQGTLILKVPRGELEAARQAEALLKTRLAQDSKVPDK
ncbi:hypothetical protein BH20ACT11_BH20ACT11_08530 [soil metagenome]